MLKTTALNAVHRALGARLLCVGGWEMPVNYGSVLAEHHAVRRDCGMFDVSCLMQVDIHGPDARVFLWRLLANNVDKLEQPGRALYSPMLNDDGGVMDDLIVHRLADQHYRLTLDPERAATTRAWLDTWRTHWRQTVTLSTPEDGRITLAVQGPNARARVWAVLPEIHAVTAMLPAWAHVQVGACFVASTGYTGEQGFEITLPAPQGLALWHALRAIGVTPCGVGARDSLRTEAGLRLHGRDLDASLSPLDAGLGWAVDMTDGRDFIGRQAMLARGQQWRFLGLQLLGKGLLRDQQSVLTEHGPGQITSASYSPTLDAYIALARLPMGVAVGDLAHASLRGRPLPVRVMPPRFVHHGRILTPLPGAG